MNIKKIKSYRVRTSDGAPNPIDIHVGRRISLRRTSLNYCQDKLASLLGITFQQVQKYERGHNRVSASLLWDIAKVLNIPIDFFYEEMDVNTINQSTRQINSEPQDYDEYNPNNTDPMYKEETIKLVKAYYKTKNASPQLALKFKEMLDLI